MTSKRNIVECLIVAGHGTEGSIDDACYALNFGPEVWDPAIRLRREASPVLPSNETDYMFSCLEAAYRLIESDPILVKEWFECASKTRSKRS